MNDFKLTKNFSIKEFFVSESYPDIAEQMWDNEAWQYTTEIYLLCKLILQPVRDFIKVPIEITSGFRNCTLNSKVAKTSKSLHMRGIACDFVADSDSLKKAYNYIKTELSNVYGQLLLYKNTDGTYRNIHVSLPYIGHEQIGDEIWV